ncbi:MAG: UDP-N-acetylmuramoyl-tripeptide--D-alanyl-D-alanine ligase [Ruminococcaceae bacterium]|nr:UDP-N-acetylmuramoyl-tripeptide--D-alanyl-D-alanine ligase [Oscillospiraceae bacterium]
MRIELPFELRDPTALASLFECTLQKAGDAPIEIGGISTDTRELLAGDLFLALRGERTDGHAYICDALSKGAGGVLCHEKIPPISGNYWVLACKDTSTALLAAAKRKRAVAGARVIAVTGSAGKTTAKEAIATILGGVPCNKGNFNSTVGMPLSLLEFPTAKYWVCELGINHVGEMNEMASALSPDVAVITNVGNAHIGNFGDFPTLLSQKMMIAEGMREDGILLLPKEIKASLPQKPRCRMLSFGEGADLSTENIAMDRSGVCCDFRVGKRVITNLRWPIAGVIGQTVITIAAAVGVLCGRDDEQIRAGLLQAGACAPRMRVFHVGTRLLLEDCYNASPEAVMAAFESLRYLAAGRPTVAVLGDMLELGTQSRAMHAMLGEVLAKSGFYALFTVGCAAFEIARAARRAGMAAARIYSFEAGECDATADAVLRHTPANAAILIKGSHAMHLERVCEKIRRTL